MPKNYLVCAGGGSLGIAQVQVLNCLRKEGKLNFDVLLGTSTGNLTATVLAFAPDLSTGLDNLNTLYKNIKGTSDIFTGKSGIGIPILSNIANVITAAVDELTTSWPGTLSNSPEYALLQKSVPHIKPCVEVSSFITNIENMTKIVVTAYPDGTFSKKTISGAVLLNDVAEEKHDSSWFPTYLLYVLASTAFPPEIDAVTIEKAGGFVDGGLCRMVPVDGIIEEGADSVTVLLCGEWGPATPYSGSRDGLQYALRTISTILYWQVQDSLNELAENCKLSNVPLTIYTLTPGIVFPASDQFDPKIIEQVLAVPNATPVYQSSKT